MRRPTVVANTVSRAITLGCVVFASAPGCSEADRADVSPGSSETELGRGPSRDEATFTTVFQAPLATEGLAVDRHGNLYTAGRGGNPTCPVWRVPSSGGAAVVVGNLPAPCSPNGLVFAGEWLYVTDGADKIYRLRPSASTPPAGALFASGVPGANGLAFDERGQLWATDGGTAQGRVWSIAPNGAVTEKFRIQPLANTVNVAPDTQLGGVGRDARALPPGQLTITPSSRVAADAAGSVAIVANGIAFVDDRELLVSDTARGAIWSVRLDRNGNVTSSVGCDTTFTPNTLCLENLLVQHPALEGLDGITIDERGTIWGTANERNALVAVSKTGTVRELFRNAPASDTQLRNVGPLEFPTTPVLVRKKLCFAQTDVNRRDNFPNSGGEVGPGAGRPLAKVACLDQPLPHPVRELH